MYSNFKPTFLALSVAILACADFQPARAQSTTQSNPQFDIISTPAASQTLGFTVHLPLRNSEQLDKLIADQSSPGSPQYRKFLTVAQFREQFGPSDADFNRVASALQAAGFQVTGKTSQTIEAQGSVANLDQKFGAQIVTVRYRDGHTALKSMTPLKLPAELAQSGAQIIDFSPMIRQHTDSIRSASPIPANRYSQSGPYWFDDLKQAYDFPSDQTVNGAGRTIGIVIPSDFNDNDINTYFAHENIQPPTIRRRPVNGGAPFNSNSGNSEEAELDIEQAGGMAPQATIVLYNIRDLSDQSIFNGYTALVEDNQVDIVNSSFGGCEKFYTAAYNNGVDYTRTLQIFDDLFRQGNAQGITFVASSGDNAGLACPAPAYFRTPPTNPPSVVASFIPGVEFPASSPHVTAVGGTNLVTTYNPPSLESNYIEENAYSDPLKPYDPNGVGNLVSGGMWGSGGGESIFFPKPSFQQSVNTATQYRAVPDVSLHMGGCPGNALQCGPDPRSADIEVFAGSIIGVIGTSASSPDFAGILALKQQSQGGVRFGNENVDIYNLAALNATSQFKFYRQNIPGENGFVKTLPTYNEVLGNGTLDVKNFLGLPSSPSAGNPQTPSNP